MSEHNGKTNGNGASNGSGNGNGDQEEPKGLVFPCDFPLKMFGKNTHGVLIKIYSHSIKLNMRF